MLINVLLGVTGLIYWFIHWKLQYWSIRNVPHIEPEFLYGNSRGFNKDFCATEFVRNMYLKLKSKGVGPIAGVYIYIQPQALIMDLDLAKQILVKEFNIFTNRGLYHNEVDDPLSANLAFVEDDVWRSLRQKISPVFSTEKLKLMFGAIAEISDKLIETIEKETKLSGQLEVKYVMHRFTIDVIGSVAFGIECSSLEDPSAQFYEMGLKTISAVSFVKVLFLGVYGNLCKKLHMTTTNKEAGDFYYDVIRKTIKYREENPQLQRNDFLNLLIKSRGQDALTFNEIAAQSVVFFAAGFETSSTTLTFCMYELSINEDIQRKARDSVKEVLKKYGNDFSFEAVNEMHYVEQCINETLRKYSPAMGSGRVAKENYSVPNTNIVIEKGTKVFIPFSGIHLDPDIYPDPKKFDPDRFAPEEVKKRHPYAFLPFGQGPRICIAMRFAIVEMKIALAKILINYEFCLDRSKTSVPIKFEPNHFLLTPKEGIMIDFKKV